MTALNDHVFKPGFNLCRKCLIEASAGTGKTYSIQTLYLRLVVEQGLTVQQILVVTFTEAATKELRDRLRGVLQTAQHCLKAPAPGKEMSENDKQVRKILELPLQALPPGSDQQKERRNRLRWALLDFDEASIFTIHGFCSRVLKRFAFECGHPFDAELVPGAGAVVTELCEDWWRKNMYPASSRFKCQISTRNDNILTLDRLKAVATQWIGKPDSKLVPEPDANTPDEAQIKEAIRGLADKWKANSAAIKTALKDARAQGYLTDEFADTVPAALDKLVNEHSAHELAILSAILDFIALPNISIMNHYVIPAKVQSFITACQSVNKILKDQGINVAKGQWKTPENGITQEKWNSQLDILAEAWSQSQNEVQYFIGNAMSYLTKAGTENLCDEAKRKEVFDAFANPQAKAKTIKSALNAFSKIKKRDKLEWEIPPETSEFVATANALLEAMKVWLTSELVKAVQAVSTGYVAHKRDRTTLTYDDLLVNVRATLRDPGRRDRFLAGLRREYKAALIDEFQDTDPVQFEIFKTVFMNSPTALPVFLVGDPKQAIYSFRGGDIYAYYAASNENEIPSDNVFALDTNYRSEDRLIAGVNQIFKDPPLGSGAECTFLNEKIKYAENLKAQGKNKDECLLIDGCPDEAPFKVWFYPCDEKRQPPGQLSPFARHIYADTAEEIVQILNDDKTTIGTKRIQPSDITILVLTHAEASMTARELAQRNVPAVRQSTGKVFESAEARDMALVLAAIQEPRNPRRIRSALATDLFACTDAEIACLANGEHITGAQVGTSSSGTDASDQDRHKPTSMEDWITFFQEIHDLWRKHSFIAALNRLIGHTGMRAHLVGLDFGERRLTNLLQLVELTHHAVVAQRLSMENTLTWVARQLDQATREDNNEYEMRLETDDDAVKIMTIFHSKGLQFPIVFVPTMWRRQPWKNPRSNVLEYHTDVTGGTSAAIQPLLMDLTAAKEGESKWEQERREEDIRLFYVAATRSINRTYIMWGGAGEKSPLAHILGTDEKIEERIRARMAPGESLAVTVKIRTDPVTTTKYRPALPIGMSISCQTESCHCKKEPAVDKTHGHSSFSAIAPGHGGGAGNAMERYDFDAVDVPKIEPALGDIAQDITLLNFPAGAKTGECWHRILETIDFKASDEEIRRVVKEQLGLFRLDKGKTEKIVQQKRNIVEKMVKDLLPLELCDDHGKALLKLSNISLSDRCSEMEFDFSLPPWTPEEEQKDGRRTKLITEVLKKHWTGNPEKLGFLAKLERWDRQIPRGFMTGSIDLVCEHGGKYYIIDWKSNRRTGRIEDFKLDDLRKEIAENTYFLQYLIYTVAVHNYLRGCKKDYEYEKHFGGVFYLFLRGLDAEGHGIYYDRPTCDMISDLSNVLGDFS